MISLFIYMHFNHCPQSHFVVNFYKPDMQNVFFSLILIASTIKEVLLTIAVFLFYRNQAKCL